MSAAGRSGRGTRSIGAVLDALRHEFPDVTISKIRFLESEGLLTPARTPAGYRQFTDADVQRLRFVLTAQRDHYLPLRVIRDQLDGVDAGLAAVPRRLAVADPGPDGPAATTERTRLTREDVCARTGVDEKLMGELEAHGVLRPGRAGFYDPDAVLVVTTAARLVGYGLQPRHLRGLSGAAEREAGLLAQLGGPVGRRDDAEARGRAEELVRELATLSTRLHTTLVRAALRRELEE